MRGRKGSRRRHVGFDALERREVPSGLGYGSDFGLSIAGAVPEVTQDPRLHPIGPLVASAAQATHAIPPGQGQP